MCTSTEPTKSEREVSFDRQSAKPVYTPPPLSLDHTLSRDRPRTPSLSLLLYLFLRHKPKRRWLIRVWHRKISAFSRKLNPIIRLGFLLLLLLLTFVANGRGNFWKDPFISLKHFRPVLDCHTLDSTWYVDLDLVGGHAGQIWSGLRNPNHLNKVTFCMINLTSKFDIK